MDVCPISFGPNLPSRPNPLVEALSWEHPTSQTIIDLDFDTVMDDTFEPANASWEIKVDSVVKTIDTITWPSTTTLQITLDTAAAPSVDVTIELLVQDPALHSEHLIPVLPFGPTDVPSA